MRTLVVVLTVLFLVSCAGIQHPDIAIYNQSNTMLDRCNVIGQTGGNVYMGMNHPDNRSINTIEAKNAMRAKAKQMGGDALLTGDIARSDVWGNYMYTMTVLNCGQQKEASINTNYKVSTEQRLAKLKTLFDNGTISEEDYKAAKVKILTDI